ncbi:MAG: methyltransferase domain-containing protein [Rikenellaceae bacterium]
MIDKKLVERRFASHFDTYNNHAKVQQAISIRLAEKLSNLCLNPKKGLEIGAGTGFLTRQTTKLYSDCSWTLNDISHKAHPYLEQICRENRVVASYIFEDAECYDFQEKFDLVVSASVVQWFDDLEGFIAKLPVKSGSIIAITTFDNQNFREIAFATNSQGLRYFGESDFCRWFDNNGYEKLLCESYCEMLEFENPTEVLRHLKYTGVNAIENVKWSRGKLEKFCEIYSSNFSSKNGVLLTYNPILMIFRKK